MNILRNEIRTGLLVVLSLAALVALLIYLGAPGFSSRSTLFSSILKTPPERQARSHGAVVRGLRIGQVRKLYSPVREKDRPNPKLETLIEVQVNSTAQIFKKVKVQITQPSLLGDSVIDFSSGEETSGLAQDGAYFIGERAGGLSDLAPTVMERLDPVLGRLSDTLESLQKTSDNLSKITAEGADLPKAFAEFKN